jgi:putative SOS response-associated peptidase YedK
MPVILDAKDPAEWLDPTPRPKKELVALLKPLPSEAMQANPVSNTVNNPTNHGPKCMEPQPVG